MSLAAALAVACAAFGAFAFASGYVIGHDHGYQQGKRRRWP